MKKIISLIGWMLFLLASLSAQTITVTSPKATDQWCIGGSYTITWKKSGAMQNVVAIRLRYEGTGQSGAAALAIVDSTVNDEYFVWEIPDEVAPGNYYIRVKTVDGTVSDDGQVFKIKTCTPTITVTSPNGGEEWVRGTKRNITWTAASWSGKVHLSLYKGNIYKGEIAIGIPSAQGSYSWVVGKTNKGLAEFGKDYRISVGKDYETIVAFLNALADSSNGSFTIRPILAGNTQVLKQLIAKKNPIKVSLVPSVSNKWYRKHSWSNALGCPLSTSGIAPDPDPHPLMRTGFENRYDGGLCWEYIGYIYRSIVRFDFSQIKGDVQEATIGMKCTGTDSNDGAQHCDGAVLVLDGPGSGFNNPFHQLVNLPASGGPWNSGNVKVSGPFISITVTDLVKAWISGQQPNHGLEFLGNNENMVDDDNHQCISHFQISLSVTYIPD